MKAVVLAAGEGTRLRPLTDDTPKPLVPVNGRPLLTHCFEQLRSLGIDEIVPVIGPKREQIIDYYGHSFEGIPILYAHQPEPNGLAHALLAAESHVDEDFIVTYGDVIFRTNFAGCLSHHQSRRPDATLLVMDVPPKEAKLSGVCVTDENGKIEAVIEKPDDPPTTTALPGFYVFSQVIFPACRIVTPSERGEYELLDAINLLVQAGRQVELVLADGWRINVNTPKDAAEADRRLSTKSSSPNETTTK